MNRLQRLEQTFPTNTLPEFEIGDTVRVHVKVIEGEKERIQVFEGLVIARKGKVRRAKLYYLRDKKGKQAKVAEREFSKGKKDKATDDVVPVPAPEKEPEAESVSSD